MAAAKLADEGHLVRLWSKPRGRGGATALGLYRAESDAQLDALLADLPLADWLRVDGDAARVASGTIRLTARRTGADFRIPV